jgi:uncharacterized protein Yka (UPF0111/DUF47 family)
MGLSNIVSRTVALLNDVVTALMDADDKRLKDLHSKIKHNKELAESMKEDALSYLARLGDILNTSTLYRGVFLSLTRVAQLGEGLAYRAYLVASNSPISSPAISEFMTKLANTIMEEYEKLESSIQLLSTSPRRSYEETQIILELEDRADDLYRQLVFTMYKTLHSNLVGLMLLRDIADMMEDIADLIRDASEDVKFLALHKAQRG